MGKSITHRNSKEVLIQLKRAEVQKNILIKNIYKEYEIYFHIVRKSILSSAIKGIFGIYSEFSISSKALNSRELNNFLNKNISLLIHSKLPFITIEQLNLGDISDTKVQILNVNSLNDFVKTKEYQTVNFEYGDEICREPLEFHCNNNSTTYEYYESLIEDESLSVNLDKSKYFNSFSEKISKNNIEFVKHIVDSGLELMDKTNNNKTDDYEKTNDQLSNFLISSENLNFFEIIDKSFSNFLLDLSYKVNSELFNINLIKKFISEDILKCLLNNNYMVKHPYPFVISCDLNSNKLYEKNNKNSNIYLLNLTNVELEFYNLDLSICRNNINELKSRFRLLNKKQNYWKNKDLNINNPN